MSATESFSPVSDYASASSGVQKFPGNSVLSNPSKKSCHRMLIFINPASGQGRANNIFEHRVKPILSERSDIRYDVVKTTQAGEARDYVRNYSTLADDYDSIVVVSGDGLFHEIVNGLMHRTDWDSAIKIPIGVVPGGSGNGLAHSINYAINKWKPSKSDPVMTSTMNVLSRRPVPLDLVRVKATNATYWSFLSFGWGLMADIDIESECLRMIGEARFTVWGVVRLCSLRRYHGKLCYIPHPEYNIEALRNSNSSNPKKSRSFTKLIFKNGKRRSSMPDDRKTSGSVDSLESSDGSVSRAGTPPSVAAINSHDMDASTSPSHSNTSSRSNSDESPDNWVTLERDFILVYAAYQTHLQSDVIFAPQAKFNDGVIWLIYLTGDVSRRQTFQFLTSMEKGHHINLPFVNVVPVLKLKLEPRENTGLLTLDGELIPTSPIEAEVVPGMARLIVK